MRSHWFPLLVLFVGWRAGASAQSKPDEPPVAIVAAASDSFHEYDGATFDQLLSSSSPLPATIVIQKSYEPNPNSVVYKPGKPLPTHIAQLANHSDAGFIGVPIKSWSFPTSDHAFAMTIYLVHVIDLAYSRNQNRRVDDDVYVARAGGEVDYKNHHFKAIDQDFPQFALNQPLVFFGRDIADGLYKVYSNGVLAISNGSVQEANTSKAHSRIFQRKTPTDVLHEASAAWQEEGKYSRGNR